jgi:hypothetical protein
VLPRVEAELSRQRWRILERLRLGFERLALDLVEPYLVNIALIFGF